MAFLEDPRLRQRWNQITHDAEAATENAAAGIWSFQHNYINPCFGSLTESLSHCTTVCLGDPEERIRKRRERERAQAEYSFDFYDDWYQEEAGPSGSSASGLLGGWGGEDWDRLLAGTGSQKKHHGASETEQPRKKAGMNYGTRGGRRRKASNVQDPTVIPSTQPIGFLSKLPWKMGGTLRYKPSAADLQDHPKTHDGEAEPLLMSDDESDYGEVIVPRKRSGTTGSGDTGHTSDSYRSRGDLFPSDGEGEEDAVPLDDEVTYDMVRKDDRSSGGGGKSRSRSSKGKRPVGFFGSRTVSRTTIGSMNSMGSAASPREWRSSSSIPQSPAAVESVPSLEDLRAEEERLRDEEEKNLRMKKELARQLAKARGLDRGESKAEETKPEVTHDEGAESIPESKESSVHLSEEAPVECDEEERGPIPKQEDDTSEKAFVPARLPFF